MSIKLGERKNEKKNIDMRNIDLLPPIHTCNQTHNPGMCHNQESNPQPFGIWDVVPTNRTTRLELKNYFSKMHLKIISKRNK